MSALSLAILNDNQFELLRHPRLIKQFKAAISSSFESEVEGDRLLDQILKQPKQAEFIVSALSPDQLLDSSRFGISVLNKLLKFGGSEPIWKAVLRVLPKKENPEILKIRLKELLKKDENNLNVIDYSIMRSKGVVAEYITAFAKHVNGEELTFPKLAQVTISENLKSGSEVEDETRILDGIDERVKMAGGFEKYDKKLKLKKSEILKKFEIQNLDIYSRKILGGKGNSTNSSSSNIPNPNKELIQKIENLEKTISQKYSNREDIYFKFFEIDFDFLMVDTLEALI